MSSHPTNPSPKPKPGLKRWLPVLAVLAVLALGAGVTAYVFRSNVKAKLGTWRAEDHVKQAKRLAEQGNWAQSFQLALAAHKLNPASLEALRVLFPAATKTNFPDTANIAGAIFMHAGSSFEEKLNLLSYLDLSRNDRHFTGLFGQLDETQRQHPDAQFLMIRFLLTRGGLDQARKMLDAYFAGGGQEKRFQGLRARLLLFGKPEEREEGQKLVAALMQDADGVAQQAFGLLWDLSPNLLKPELFPAGIDQWVDKLPNAGAREKLIAAQFQLAASLQNPEKQEAIFRQAVAGFGVSDPETLCNWLMRFQKFDLILGVVDEEKGRSSVALFDHRMRALTAVQGPEAAESWLNTPLPDASPLQIWLSRAKLARLRKDRLQEQKCWKYALSVAEVDETSRQFLPIFRTAMQMRELDIACRALLAAAPHPKATFPASLEIQPIIDYLYGKDRLKDLSVISQRILKDEPGNPVLLNNLIYISLVLDTPLEDSVSIARDLVEKHPRILGLRTTLALALCRERKSSEALPVLQSSDADWDMASPADLTIYALVLEDAGQTDKAEEIRRKIDRNNLTGTERRSFSSVLKEENPVQNPDQLFADIRTWMIQGGQKHARQLLEEYFASGGKERRFLALLAELLLQLHYSDNDPLRGQEIVAQLLDEADEHARRVFALLAEFPADLLSHSVFPPDLPAWVQGFSNPSPAEAIAAAKVEFLRSSKPEAGDKILSDLIRSQGKSSPKAVAALLTEFERFDLVVEFLDETSTRSSPELRDYRLQALLKTQGPDAARQWLESFRSAEETPQAWLSTAKLSHSLGDVTGALTAFREASSLAGRDQTTNHFLAIYETAQEVGQVQVAIRALLSASLHPQRQVPPVTELAPILSSLYAKDRLDDMHTLARTLLNQDPSNDALRNLQAYFSLILKDPTSRALEVTEDLVKRHPHILGFRATRALALTLEEKFDEALEVLPREPEPWIHASAVDLAVLALAQENAGDLAAAEATRARFDPDDLAPTERRAIAAAKRKLPVPVHP